MDNDTNETLETLTAMVVDATTAAEAVLAPLDCAIDTDLSEARNDARALLDCFRTAETVEKLGDFVANIHEARLVVVLLAQALTLAKADAKSDSDDVAVEAIRDAQLALRDLARELSDIEAEIKAAL